MPLVVVKVLVFGELGIANLIIFWPVGIDGLGQVETDFEMELGR